MSDKTATMVKDVSENFNGTAKLWKLDPPFEVYEDWDDENKVTNTYDHVITSATYAPYSGDETYIFPADENGEVTSWGELAGSYCGGQDHAWAIEGMGYTPVEG